VNRRQLLLGAGTIPLLSVRPSLMGCANAAASKILERARPGDPLWPPQSSWDRLNDAVRGRLLKVVSPLDVCRDPSEFAQCDALFKELKNPYYIRDQVNLAQTTGWVDAWTSQPSAYAVAASNARDVVAAVNFARENNLRLVVKGAVTAISALQTHLIHYLSGHVIWTNARCMTHSRQRVAKPIWLRSRQLAWAPAPSGCIPTTR
jgi:hypothetical protein